jgi:hypothetical protein
VYSIQDEIFVDRRDIQLSATTYISWLIAGISGFYFLGWLFDPQQFAPDRVPLMIITASFTLLGLAGVLFARVYPRRSTKYRRAKGFFGARFKTKFAIEEFNTAWSRHQAELAFAQANYDACSKGYGPIMFDGQDFTVFRLAIDSDGGPVGFLKGATSSYDDRTTASTSESIARITSNPVYGTRNGIDQVIREDFHVHSFKETSIEGSAYVHVVGEALTPGTLSFRDPEEALEVSNLISRLSSSYFAGVSALPHDTRESLERLNQLEAITRSDFDFEEAKNLLNQFDPSDWGTIFPRSLEYFLAAEQGQAAERA